jgi:nicotinamidase-related amidase
MAQNPGPFDLALDALVLLVDVQPAFVDGMCGGSEPLLVRLERLLRLATLADLPVLASVERPTSAKGALVPRLEAAMPPSAQRFEKSTFDCMGERTIRAALASSGRRTVIVAGAETDVCILQTVLGLLAAGYEVRLLEDCVFSSDANVSSALRRMDRAGATLCTFKTFLYELTLTVDRESWPDAWRQRLISNPELLLPPEDLPPLEGSLGSEP